MVDVVVTLAAPPVARGGHLRTLSAVQGSVESSLAESVPDAGLWAKAQWYATETVRNLWGMVT